MTTVKEILEAHKKPKETVELLAEKLKSDGKAIEDLIQCFETGSAAEKGHCMEALEYTTKANPEFAKSCLDFVIEHLNDKEPRVKWEASRIIGNVAQRLQEKVKEAISKLLENTKDKGTVVRWSAAFALTEIAKAIPELKEKILSQLKEIANKETNNGVRNIYIKFFKGKK